MLSLVRQLAIRSNGLLSHSIQNTFKITNTANFSAVSKIPEKLPQYIKESIPKYLDGFNEAEELKQANNEVKKIFSIDMANHKELRNVIKTINNEKYETALERNIANNTCQIRMLTNQLKLNHKDKKNKVFFIWLIDQRKKKLRRLEKLDINKYIAIIKEFEIPPLQSPHEPHNKYRFRQYKINVPIKKKREIEDFEYDRVY